MITLWLRAPTGEWSHSTWRAERIEIVQSAFDGCIRASAMGAGAAGGRGIEFLLVAEIEECAEHTYLVRDHDDRERGKGHARIYVKGKELMPFVPFAERPTPSASARFAPVPSAIAREGDPIRIDDWMLRIGKPRLPIMSRAAAEMEARFLHAVEHRPDDDELREVYADWLEENGRLRNADLLRLQSCLKRASPDEPNDLASLTAALRSAARDVDDAWRWRVARPAIEMCRRKEKEPDEESEETPPQETAQLRFDVECPKEWDKLTRTADDKVRHCDTCKSPVTYCTTVAEAARISVNGGCVALDPSLARRPNDIDPPERNVKPAWSGRMGQVCLWPTTYGK